MIFKNFQESDAAGEQRKDASASGWDTTGTKKGIYTAISHKGSNTGKSVTSSVSSSDSGVSSDLGSTLSAMSVRERVSVIDTKKGGKLDSGFGKLSKILSS